MEPTEEQWKDWTRVAAKSVIDKVDNYEDLNAPDEEGGNQKFREMAIKVWKEVAVHGFLVKDAETGEVKVLSQTDLDGKCALAMLRRAGLRFEDEDITYTEPLGIALGKFNVDTGRKNGVAYENGTLIVDHHAEESGRDTSATKFVYELMIKLNMMERDPVLDKLVTFETQMDNWAYPKGNQREFYEGTYKNMVGLSRFLNFDKLYDFFNDGGNPEADLTPEQIERYGLEGKPEEMRQKIQRSIEEIEKIDTEGGVVETSEHGRVVISVNSRVPLGFEACRALGYGGCLYWFPEDQGFMLVTREHLNGDLYEGSINMRKRIIIKPRWRSGELKMSLDEMKEKIKTLL